MIYDPTIRPERTIEQFSRGGEVIQAIQTLWDVNQALPAGSNRQVNDNIYGLCAEFDLTLGEWHYWCRQIHPHYR